MYKKLSIYTSIWENAYKTTFHLPGSNEGKIRCSGKCNAKGSQCSMFKFNISDGVCSIVGDEVEVDIDSSSEEQQTDVFANECFYYKTGMYF